MNSRLRKWVKSNVRVGVRRCAKFAVFEAAAAFQTNWTSLLFRPNGKSGLKLNIGCGAKRKEGWVNVDLYPTADVKTDARRKLPFRDNSASLIYSEHFFEHLDYPEEATKFLAESLRVLAPGGLFSVGIPDVEMVLRAYGEGSFTREAVGLPFVDWCKTPMQYLNFLFHQGGEHKQLYDFLTLAQVLRDMGFENVRRRTFDAQLDSEDRKIGTMYVDARKKL